MNIEQPLIHSNCHTAPDGNCRFCALAVQGPLVRLACWEQLSGPVGGFLAFILHGHL